MDVKSIVSTRGQVVIPKFVREILGLHYGSEIIFNIRKDKVLEIRTVQHNITEFFGKGKNLNLSTKTIDVDDTIAKAIADNISAV